MYLWIAAFAALAFLLYRKLTAKHGYWETKGIPCLKAYPLLGSYPSMFTGKTAAIENSLKIYEDTKAHDVLCYYVLTDPVLVVNNPELIREIGVKAFDHFVDRVGGSVVDTINEIQPESSKMLTGLTGEKWKAMRSAMSPAFTTGKLKRIVGAINRTGPGFKRYM